MADAIVASEKQFQEYAEKLGGIANDAASKIIEARIRHPGVGACE